MQPRRTGTEPAHDERTMQQLRPVDDAFKVGPVQLSSSFSYITVLRGEMPVRPGSCTDSILDQTVPRQQVDESLSPVDLWIVYVTPTLIFVAIEEGKVEKWIHLYQPFQPHKSYNYSLKYRKPCIVWSPFEFTQRFHFCQILQ